MTQAKTKKPGKAGKAKTEQTAPEKKLIIFTGVPGTGKSTVAKALARKLKAKLIALNDVVEKFGLYSGVDVRDGAKIVRMAELERKTDELIAEEMEGTAAAVIVEGHLACEMKLLAKGAKTIVIVCRTKPEELKKRMAGRGYSVEKIKENAMAEMLDYCVVWAEKKYGAENVRELDTTGKGVAKSAGEALALIEGKKKSEKVDWSRELFDSV